MFDARIGRLLVASLHQGIADAAPERVDFYEDWLNPIGRHEGRTGLAALNAALSFLRREGRPAYDRIMTSAGQFAAQWAYMELPRARRGIGTRLPAGWRARAALRVARRVARDTYQDTRLKTHWWRRGGTLRLQQSVFCSVREASPDMLCIYYAAVVERLLALYRVDAAVDIDECRACGNAQCVLTVRRRSGATAATGSVVETALQSVEAAHAAGD